jgi:hypothetical protein
MMNNNLCNFLTQPHPEDLLNAEYESWLADEFSKELASIEDEFAPGMLEAYPELWANINLLACDTEEDTLA